MKMVVEIELGNEAMQTASDVIGAVRDALLRQASSHLEPLNQHEVGTIRDANGNTVGEWRTS